MSDGQQTQDTCDSEPAGSGGNKEVKKRKGLKISPEFLWALAFFTKEI